MLADETVEGGLGDAIGVEQVVLDAEAIEGAFVGALVVEVGCGGVDGFEEFLGGDLACLALVLAGAGGHAGDAVVFVAVVPGLDGAPGELAWVAVLIEEGHGGDVVDALVACSSRGGVDGAEDAHLQVDRRLLHECSPVGGPWRARVDCNKSVGWPSMTACVAGVCCCAGAGGGRGSALSIRSRWRWTGAVAPAEPCQRHGQCHGCVSAGAVLGEAAGHGRWAGDDRRA